MTSKLDKSKKYGFIYALSGVRFVQDGRHYGALGNLVEKDETGKYVPVDVPEAPKKEVKLVEFDIDTIEELSDFDDFAAALMAADAKPAKGVLKEFALDMVGMAKLNSNKKLENLIEEVRAEFKSLLESGIV